jgi:hypothetical protein
MLLRSVHSFSEHLRREQLGDLDKDIEVTGSCEHGNELSGCMKFRVFFDQVNDCQFLKKDFAQLNFLVNR